MLYAQKRHTHKVRMRTSITQRHAYTLSKPSLKCQKTAMLVIPSKKRLYQDTLTVKLVVTTFLIGQGKFL